MSAHQSRPRDGPATSFEVDDLVATLLAVKNGTNTSDPDEFGLVMVAGWPPTNFMTTPYEAFLSSIRECFDDKDLTGDFPAVYLYPSSCLHVTVATLHSIAHKTRNPQERSVLESKWRSIVVGASRRSEWPTKPLELEMDSAQIGTRAGILLWKETTGRLDEMRSCIRNETNERRAELQAAGIDIETLAIPGIVHSSFLRFHKVPQTNGCTVQERFQAIAVPRLKKLFSSPIVVKDARLVCERTPYMHIPNDERHVFESFSLQS